jgi:hypothetical protein
MSVSSPHTLNRGSEVLANPGGQTLAPDEEKAIGDRELGRHVEQDPADEETKDPNLVSNIHPLMIALIRSFC